MKSLLLTFVTLIGFLSLSWTVEAAAASTTCSSLKASDSESTVGYLLQAGAVKAAARTPYDACMELRNSCLEACPGGGYNAEAFCKCLNQKEGMITCYTDWNTGDGGAPGICKMRGRSSNGTGLPSSYCPKKVDGNDFPTCDHLKPKKATAASPAGK